MAHLYQNISPVEIMCDSSGQTIMHHRGLIAWIHTYHKASFVSYIFIILAWANKKRMSLCKEPY
jgi:hypothetical protein